MKRTIIALAALLLTGCGATAATPAPTVTVTETASPSAPSATLARPFTYMGDFEAALAALGVPCDAGEPLDLSPDTNVRTAVKCSAMGLVLLNVDISAPAMVAVRNIYAMKAPYMFTDHNWIIWTGSEDNARYITEQTGYQPTV